VGDFVGMEQDHQERQKPAAGIQYKETAAFWRRFDCGWTAHDWRRSEVIRFR
jgi:hypothetical protein